MRCPMKISRLKMQYHCKEFTACQDVCSAIRALNEDIVSSYQLDFDMEVGTSHNLSNSEAIIEKVQGSRSSEKESKDLEMISMVEEEPPDPAKSFGEDQQNKEEHATTRVLEVEASDQWHAESSVQELWDKSICQEACLNLEMFVEVEEEPARPSRPSNENQTDRQQIKLPDMAQSESENHQVTKEDCNLSNTEASMEKLRVNIVYQEYRDVEMYDMVEEPHEHSIPVDEEHHSAEEKRLLEVEEHRENTGSFDEEHQTDADLKTPLVMTSPGCTYRVSREDHTFSVTIDTTPQSKFPGASGVTTPEFLVIPTPSAKEGARAMRKRKCVFDDMIVFPNNIIKQSIEDSSNLVTKRRKAPHTALAAWRACRVSSLPWCFMEPLIPCTSTELRSLFCNAKHPQKFRSQCLIDRSLETVEPSEKLDKPKSCDDHRSVESMKSLEKLNVTTFPTVGRSVQTVEPPEMLDLPETPTAGRFLEQMAIAPETPILHTKSLRSFESPERPEISNLDKVRLESDKVEKEIYSSKEQEIDLSMMNEEINLFEVHNQDQYGWSERTRVVASCLHKSYLDKRKRREEEVVNLLHLLEGRTKKESARLFYEILVLKSKGYVHVEQKTAYGDILVWKASQWEQAQGVDCVNAAAGTTYLLQEP
ncbi:sister chromatid cohesion 1 protein 2 isoform X2 [Jatropha curcas]|uniref:sister chromatid cohesion 1 protein 2 isoform X2 n=1 Tax=Jatropha curcas TaxID=180498 RepID=UPI0005FB1A30|nr:sister chromatid cohesion 1 protein 2 isoform X2 [Jatropha curcas]